MLYRGVVSTIYNTHYVHLNLKFEIERPETTPSGLSLSLLDFKATISKDIFPIEQFYIVSKLIVLTPASDYPPLPKSQVIVSLREGWNTQRPLCMRAQFCLFSTNTLLRTILGFATDSPKTPSLACFRL